MIAITLGGNYGALCFPTSRAAAITACSRIANADSSAVLDEAALVTHLDCSVHILPICDRRHARNAIAVGVTGLYLLAPCAGASSWSFSCRRTSVLRIDAHIAFLLVFLY
jgi:hypothetical protein